MGCLDILQNLSVSATDRRSTRENSSVNVLIPPLSCQVKSQSRENAKLHAKSRQQAVTTAPSRGLQQPVRLEYGA